MTAWVNLCVGLVAADPATVAAATAVDEHDNDHHRSDCHKSDDHPSLG